MTERAQPAGSRPGPPWSRILTLVAGLALLALVLIEVDLDEVAGHLAAIGLAGALAVLAVYLAAFVVDTASWQLMLPSLRQTGTWLKRLWCVRMVGEAWNVILPTSIGGEPVKAHLLKRRFGISFHESGASLVMSKTVNLLALLVFAGIGCLLMSGAEALPPGLRLAVVAGFALLAVGVLGFFAVQRWQVMSRLLRLLAGWRYAGPLGAGLARVLVSVGELDGRFRGFYAGTPGRFAAALLLAFANWGLGMAELVLIMSLLGHPITWTEAWIIETVAQLVRAGFCFIPASLGATEVIMVLAVQAFTGLPALGLAAAAIRRARELLWIVWGLSLGWWLALDPRPGRPRPD